MEVICLWRKEVPMRHRPTTGWLGATFAGLIIVLFMAMVSRVGTEHYPPEERQPDQVVLELLLGSW